MKHGSFTPQSHTFDTTEFKIVAALLDYYALPYSVRSLTDYLHRHNYGSLMTEVADCLLQHGLITTLITANPELLNRDAWRAVHNLEYPFIDPNRLPTLTDIERVISRGVLLKKLPPSLALIDEEIAQGYPVMISYVPSLIIGIRELGNSLAIIVAGDEENYTLFEPAFANVLTLCSKKTCLFSILEVKSADPSAASLLTMREKTPAPLGPPPPLPEI